MVLSSSALTIHAEPVARFLEIGHVLCNHFERRRRQGRLTGPDRQARRLGPEEGDRGAGSSATANDVDLQRSYFYADGDEDAALMQLVGNPRPVNPRPGLAAMAAENGWPVLRVSRLAAAGDVRCADWSATTDSARHSPYFRERAAEIIATGLMRRGAN